MLIRSLLLVLLLSGCAQAPGSLGGAIPSGGAIRQAPIALVRHVVVITMENRSFDHLFGTYPGVNGIPSNPTCNPDPATSKCILPYHETVTVNYGGPHDDKAERLDLDGGKVDGFIMSVEHPKWKSQNPNPDSVMAYHTCAEVPTYCNLAAKGVLADNHFAATSSWSTMAHLYMISGWSAKCSVKGDPMSCVSENDINVHKLPDYAWTDLTWLLHANGVSWGYYVYNSHNRLLVQGDGDDEAPSPDDDYQIPSGWNPLLLFDDVTIDGQISNIQPGPNFEAQAASGTLPAVSWVEPPFESSDHPLSDLVNGQIWVQSMVNAVENGPDAASTLIILDWDEWGGFYDHVVPPIVDGQGYGFRTPLILLGPMVKAGTIDHQLLSSDAYLKFIEDTFIGEARLDGSDGRPDSRPDVRENYSGLGNLRADLH
jgi:phospholipase C